MDTPFACITNQDGVLLQINVEEQDNQDNQDNREAFPILQTAPALTPKDVQLLHKVMGKLQCQKEIGVKRRCSF